MQKFAANLTMLFNELDFLDRFKAAADAGFEAVEFLFPYDYSVDELKTRLTDNNLQLVLHNLPAGDWAQGERGIACHPDRVAEFRDGVGQAINYATALNCKQINCLAGIIPEGVSNEQAEQTFVDNLKFAAEALADQNIRLLIEPINYYDIPGFFLNYTRYANRIIDRVGSDNLFIQYDIYHAQRMEGELAKTIADNLHRISHIQLADNPGRHEPGTGEINYGWLFKELTRLGYQGWIGCEYKPKGKTMEGLNWREDLNG
ncbi:hydroxypyruvate isomerase [Saccharospirillum salsuginis]|uniref:Hydroxypyruvate isomerase n=1 Tax=Saccharospirillum salsuginis TaxID=418750 RepID=A0A918N705_9GAMM|nr:hydroxypyruvate isomerase [Saccharospirillum salsuginis]GGX45845.1 hydroxypyruvate isomerase [Saccharospirillum salsuginis]